MTISVTLVNGDHAQEVIDMSSYPITTCHPSFPHTLLPSITLHLFTFPDDIHPLTLPSFIPPLLYHPHPSPHSSRWMFLVGDLATSKPQSSLLLAELSPLSPTSPPPRYLHHYMSDHLYILDLQKMVDLLCMSYLL